MQVEKLESRSLFSAGYYLPPIEYTQTAQTPTDGGGVGGTTIAPVQHPGNVSTTGGTVESVGQTKTN